MCDGPVAPGDTMRSHQDLASTVAALYERTGARVLAPTARTHTVSRCLRPRLGRVQARKHASVPAMATRKTIGSMACMDPREHAYIPDLVSAPAIRKHQHTAPPQLLAKCRGARRCPAARGLTAISVRLEHHHVRRYCYIVDLENH